MTKSQVINLAQQAGFKLIRSNLGGTVFSRNESVLTVGTASAWAFYINPTKSKAPDAHGSDHTSLAKFLKAQTVLN
jgi:hypothetical protein